MILVSIGGAQRTPGSTTNDSGTSSCATDLNSPENEVSPKVSIRIDLWPRSSKPAPPYQTDVLVGIAVMADYLTGIVVSVTPGGIVRDRGDPIRA